MSVGLSILLAMSVFSAICDEQSTTRDGVSVDARELQEKCEEYRVKHFQEGEATLNTTTLVDDPGGELGDGQSVTQHIWFSGDYLRNDNIEGPSRYRIAICGGKYIWDANPDVAVVVAPEEEYADTSSQFGLSHIRWVGLGYNAPQTLSKGRASRCLMLFDQMPAKVPSVTRDTMNGVEVWKITYANAGTLNMASLVPVEEVEDGFGDESKSGQFTGSKEEKSPSVPSEDVPYRSKNIFWIAPAQGYSLLKNQYRMVYPEKNLELVHELDAKYVQDKLSGTWYPEAVTTIIRNNGKFVAGQRYSLKDVNFQKPNPAVFELEGFSLPVDRKISNRTLGAIQKEFFWNGKEPVLIPDLVVPLFSR